MKGRKQEGAEDPSLHGRHKPGADGSWTCDMDENGITNHTETRDELLRVHEWRAEQLEQLGFSRLIAEANAVVVDWHDVARLVVRGCSPELTLESVR